MAGGVVLLLMVSVAGVMAVRAVLLLVFLATRRRMARSCSVAGMVMPVRRMVAVPCVLTLSRLSRRDVRVALAGLSGRGMGPVPDGTSARGVVATPERTAGREAPRRRTALLDRGRGRRCRSALSRGSRLRRRRRGGGRRRSAHARRRGVAVDGRRRRPATAAVRFRGRAACRFRHNSADCLVRSDRDRGPTCGRLRRVPRDGSVRPMRDRGRRRHDHLLRRRRARARARAADSRDMNLPGVREQGCRSHTEQQRNEWRRHSASDYPG